MNNPTTQMLLHRRDTLRQALHNLAEDELVSRAQQNPKFTAYIHHYEQERGFLNYLNHLPLALKTYADACKTFLNFEYGWTADSHEIFKQQISYKNLETKQDAINLANCCAILKNALWYCYTTKKSQAHILRMLCKIARLITLSPAWHTFISKKRSLALKAVVAEHYSIFMKSDLFEECVRLDQKIKVKSCMSDIAECIGQDFVVFPAVTDHALSPKDFLGLSHADEIYPLLSSKRKEQFTTISAEITYIETQLQKMEEATDGNPEK